MRETTIIGLIVAFIAAVLAFIYVPDPLGWVVGLLILVIIVVVALSGRRGRP